MLEGGEIGNKFEFSASRKQEVWVRATFPFFFRVWQASNHKCGNVSDTKKMLTLLST